jgi:Na+/melibiose symporter-like transporter
VWCSEVISHSSVRILISLFGRLRITANLSLLVDDDELKNCIIFSLVCVCVCICVCIANRKAKKMGKYIYYFHVIILECILKFA